MQTCTTLHLIKHAQACFWITGHFNSYKILSKSMVTSSTTYLFPVQANCLLQKRSTFSRSVKVSVGIPYFGHAELILLTCSEDNCGNIFCSHLFNIWTFHHVSTRQCLVPRAHHARKTVALLLAHTPGFIGPQYWPTNRHIGGSVTFDHLKECVRQ